MDRRDMNADDTNVPGTIVVPKDYLLRMIGQFLVENAIPIDDVAEAMLNESRAGQQQLSNVTIDAKTLADNVRTERWDAVIDQLSPILDDNALAVDLYEHFVRCLVANDLTDAAQTILQRAPILAIHLKRTDPSRYSLLGKIVDKEIEAFTEGPAQEEKQRLALASRIEQFISKYNQQEALRRDLASSRKPMETGRLVQAIQDAVRWRRLTKGGKLKMEWERGEGEHLNPEEEIKNSKRHQTLEAAQESINWSKPRGVASKFGKGVSVLCGAIAPDGETFATGTSDGFIELFHLPSLKSRKDLLYQANEEPLFVDNSVNCIGFSLSGDLLACGDAQGYVTIFRVSNGSTVRRLETGHANGGVTSLSFSPDDSKIATGGVEGVCRIFSVSTGSRLCECIGHDSFVNSIAFLSITRLITGSSDEKVHLWNASTGEIIKAITGFSGKILRVIPIKQNLSGALTGPACYYRYGDFTHVIVASPAKLYLVSLETAVVTLLLGAPPESEIGDSAICRSGRFVHAIAQSREKSRSSTKASFHLIVFDQHTGKAHEHHLPSSMMGSNGKAVELKALGTVHASPSNDNMLVGVWSNLIACFTE